MGKPAQIPVEVISFGEPLIGIYPPPNRSVTDDVPLLKTWGGDTSNVALALSKLGHKTAYITRIGSDEFGKSFQRLWQEVGVNISQVQIDDEHRTGLYFVSFRNGQHHLTYYRKDSAASFISSKYIDWEFVRMAKAIHLSGISQGISQDALKLSFELMEFAKKNDILISYDVNYRPALWGRDVAKAVTSHTIKEYANILEITDDEMSLLGWGKEPRDLKSSLPRVPSVCAVKMGEKGCYLVRNGKEAWIKPFQVQVQDTVGAGDAFDAGLIAGILKKLPLIKLGEFANAVAALTCRGTGPLSMQPSMEEVQKLIGSAR
jgi:2-dehydro-3-deoxygluconokinase